MGIYQNWLTLQKSIKNTDKYEYEKSHCNWQPDEWNIRELSAAFWQLSVMEPTRSEPYRFTRRVWTRRPYSSIVSLWRCWCWLWCCLWSVNLSESAAENWRRSARSDCSLLHRASHTIRASDSWMPALPPPSCLSIPWWWLSSWLHASGRGSQLQRLRPSSLP